MAITNYTLRYWLRIGVDVIKALIAHLETDSKIPK